MSIPERFWFLENIIEDENNQYEIVKQICTFIRPEAFINNKMEKEIVQSLSDDVAKQSGGKYSVDYINDLLNTPLSHKNDTITEIIDLRE
jgi:hypothetical protein